METGIVTVFKSYTILVFEVMNFVLFQLIPLTVGRELDSPEFSLIDFIKAVLSM
jgi:hypothetical protein